MKVAMILDGSISHDHRVIKMIKTISTKHDVDLYCLKGTSELNPEFNENVRVFETKQKVNVSTQFLRHTYFCYEFAFFYKKVMNSNVKYDYIWANDLPTLVPARACAKTLKAKLIYDAHEIYVETLNQFFPAKTNFIKSFFFKTMKNFMRKHGKRTESKIIKEVDQFVTVNQSLLEYFKSTYGFSKGNVIMNMPKLDERDLEAKDFRTEYSFKKEDIILLYQGNLNQGRGLTTLVSSINTLPNRFKLILIGNGTLESELKKLADSQRVKFVNTIPLRDLAGYTRGADIGINFLEPINLSKKMASPNKLFEYIHADLPVLATEGVENRKITDQYEVGELCELDAQSIVKTLEKMESNGLEGYKMNCSKAKHALKWQTQEDTILQLFG